MPALVPLNVTGSTWLAPKFVPVIVNGVPTGPEVGDRPVMAGETLKFTPLLATPATVTTTLPVVAPVGTFTVMLVLLQLVAVPALVPLKVTVLVPWLDPNVVPVIVTAVPTGPEVGGRPATCSPGPWNTSFNGATAFQPWKLTEFESDVADNTSALQWGHGLSAVDNQVDDLRGFPVWGLELQWGHGLSAVEMGFRRLPSPYSSTI